jgi:hypothetical protein
MAAALVLGVSSSRASVSPAPYLDAAYDDPFWALVGGQTWPDTFPAEWAASSAEEVSVAAGAMPALESLGTIALGIAALDIGWKIGRQVDTRWLHLSCRAADTCGDAQGSGFANTTISGLWWKRFNCSTPITGTFCTWAYNNGVLTQNADGTYGVWMYQWSSSGWPPYRCNTCDTFVKSNGAICGSNAGCVAAQYFADKHLTLGFAAGPWATGSNCDGGVPGAQCYVWVATYAQMDAALVHSLSVPYTNQPVNRTTNISAPVKTSAALDAARAKLGALGPAAQNEVNAALDPASWARPGENGSPPGGLITDWTMPDCTGYQVGDCESMVIAAALGSNNIAPSLSTALGVADATRMPGAVLGQSVPEGSTGRPSSILLSANPDPLNGFSSGGGAGGNDGSSFTDNGGEECDFDDYATPPTWADVYSEEPSFYQEECEDAWSVARLAGFVDAFNRPTPDWVVSAEIAIPGRYLTNETVVAELTRDGSVITDWAKVKSPRFWTSRGEAELHLYKNLRTGEVNLVHGWKLVFQQAF